MAYGRKYHLEFGDNKANVWDITILQDGYVGSATDVKATGSPLIINWMGGGLYQPIRGSEAVVNFFSETDEIMPHLMGSRSNIFITLNDQ